MRKTIAKNRTKAIDAIFAGVTKCSSYHLSDNFIGQDCPKDWARKQLDTFSFAKLTQSGPNTYTVQIHSNEWYELQTS